MRKFVYLTLLAAAGLAPSIAYAQDRDHDGRPQWRGEARAERGDRSGEQPRQSPQFRQQQQFQAPQQQQQQQAQPPRFQPPAQNPAPGFQGNNGGWRGNRGGGFNGQQQGTPPSVQQPPVQVQQDFGRNRGGFQANGQGDADARNRGWNGVGDRSDPSRVGGQRFDGRRIEGRADDRRFDDRRFDGRRDGYRGNNGWQGNGGNRSYYDNDRRWDRGNGRRWDNGWRRDNRYDWRDYRRYNRDLFRLPRYYAPYGWSYGYRRFGIGYTLNSLLFSQSYWIGDPEYYRLPPAYGGYRWVRYYNDALLVDIYSGEVVDVEYGIFW